MIAPGQTCRERMTALQELGHEIHGIDAGARLNLLQKIIEKIARFVGQSLDLAGLNRQIINRMQRETFHVLWVDKGLTVGAKTLRQVKKLQPDCRLVHLNPDDPFGQFRKGWKVFLKAIPCYDLHFVARTPNISEYQSFGGKNIHVYDRSFSKNLHRPLQLSEEESARYAAKIGFVGSCARERAGAIVQLIFNGLPVAVWGDGWQKSEHWELIRPHFRGGARYGEEYVKIIGGMDIALHFLRHENRDEQDSRTFEIPACGAFMLAERSAKHEAFFLENEEVVFFNNADELLEKAKYYLAHPEQVKQIAAAGRRRCLESGYDHHSRLKAMLKIVFNENSGGTASSRATAKSSFR